MDVIVSKIKLAELCEASQVQNLQNDKATKTVYVNRVEYVITGTCSSGALGWISCTGNRVVDQVNYTGKIKPATYWLHRQEVDSGKRERGYVGALVFYAERRLVLCEQVRFITNNSEEGKQESLF